MIFAIVLFEIFVWLAKPVKINHKIQALFHLLSLLEVAHYILFVIYESKPS
jgi:hypothetical protein